MRHSEILSRNKNKNKQKTHSPPYTQTQTHTHAQNFVSCLFVFRADGREKGDFSWFRIKREISSCKRTCACVGIVYLHTKLVNLCL